MNKLTAIIPTLNEEQNIEAVFKSVSFANEIIVVDSYSTDKTVELARQHNCRILLHKFENYSAQKNWAIEQSANNWILIVDADERVTKELQNEIIHILKTEPEYNAYWIYRQNYFMGKEVRYSGWQNDKVIRLFRKDKCRYNNKLVHEEIEAIGEVSFLKHKLIHNTYNGIDGYIEKLNHYAWHQASELNTSGKKITGIQLIVKPAFRFFRHFILKQGFRDGFTGLVIAFLQSYAVFTRYVKLWLLRKNMK